MTPRAAFLPKVAEEMGWGREALSALQKAGLPINAWQLPGMRFWTFTAEVFGEDSNPNPIPIPPELVGDLR